MRLSRFTILLIMAVLMLVGAAVLPLIDVAEQPRERQGRKLTISWSWPGASAKVVEQNVTSRLEGLVSAVKGVAKTESESRFGGGSIVVELKPETSVSAAKFEILSVLRQTYSKLPEGMSYPDLRGGEVVTGRRSRETETKLLTYIVNADMNGRQLSEYISQNVEKQLERNKLIKRTEVSGARDKFIELTYDPVLLSTHGITVGDLETAIRAFMGREDIVGEVVVGNARMALYLTTDELSKPLERIPLKQIDGKNVYMGDLAKFDYKDKLPDGYYRVNGQNTVYLSIFINATTDKISASREIRNEMDEISNSLKSGISLTLDHDEAEAAASELQKLVWRTALALVILLGFVWIVSRSWRYLGIITVSLIANILISALLYWLMDIRLHIYSLAGITVSMGMIIDATVVMADHYSYYRNRKAFIAILAALLTTIGSLVVVWWLPEYIQKDMYDFALIIMVNLTVALIVAYMFVPALIDSFGYSKKAMTKKHGRQLAVTWKRGYTKYVEFTQKRKWIYIVLVVLAFGIPFNFLPDKWGENNDSYMEEEKKDCPWYELCYNATLGSDFFVHTMKPTLSKVCGGTLRLFAESLSENTYSNNGESEIKLHVQAQMPLGGNIHELNDKVLLLEQFLSQQKGIKRFETRVSSWGASVDVEFTKEALASGVPYAIENKVIGKVITIGGADWSTSGVSERGFSNSLNLQNRNSRIEITGYNYDRLYRIAENIVHEMKKNNRVVDLTIETPGHDQQEDELFMEYDRERMTLYDFNIFTTHSALREMLSDRWIYGYKDKNLKADMQMKPEAHTPFDLWHMNNAQIKDGNEQMTLSDFMQIERREAKNIIPKRNQEYILRVAFNILGSYTYASKYIEDITKQFNAQMPVGFKCQNASYGWHEDTGEQYWMLLLVVVIIFFICSILFESLLLPLAILSLVPVSFIGAFLTYYFTGVEFGTGGYAALVLLAGLTVNAGIYIVAEFRNNWATSFNSCNRRKADYYVRAYNHKISAVFLTILSTVLGLIPFFIDGADNKFWFSFATGACGGLLFSVIALVFFMPIMLPLKKQ